MYGLGIAKGLFATLRQLFRRPFTVQYPEEARQVPPRARTNLLWFDERCTGCSTCAQACPDGCILVVTSPREDGSLNKDRYEIDFRLCMFCGLNSLLSLMTVPFIPSNPSRMTISSFPNTCTS